MITMSQHLPPPAITIPYVPADTFLHHTTIKPRLKLILIGDSITEQGSSSIQHGWANSSTIHYNRRMDVINRGLGGYNSHWGLAVLPLILEELLGPSTTQQVDEHTVNNNNGVEAAVDDHTVSNNNDAGQCQEQDEEVQQQ